MDSKRVQATDISVSEERDSDFYDKMVVVRSPYTGMIETSNRCERYVYSWNDAVKEVDEETSDEYDDYFASRERFRGIHLIAASVTILVLGAIVFAIMSGYSESTASAAARPTKSVPWVLGPIDKNEDADTPEVKPITSLSKPISLSAPIAPVSKNHNNPQAIEPVATKSDEKNLSAKPTAEEKTSAAYENLLAQAAKGPIKKRIQLLRDAVSANPNGDAAMARLAIVLMERQRDRAEALSLATRAVELNSNNAIAWLAIGYINQMRGKAKEARDAYARCAEGDGPKRYIRDCKSLI